MSEGNKFFVCLKKTLLFSFEKECITYLISQSLSIGIVLMSFTNKLPQILYMYKSKDTKGLSNIAIYLDVVSVLCASLYPFYKGYSFWDYGESIIVLFENIIIFCLSWKYDINQTSDRDNMSFSILVCSFLFLCYKGFFNDKAWNMIGSASTVLSMGSKLTQITSSFKEKSTGPLSTITYILNMVGNLVRIFTNLSSTKDRILIGGFIISFFLNFIIFLQIIYYNRPKKEEKEKVEEKPVKEEKENNNGNQKNKKKKKE